MGMLVSPYRHGVSGGGPTGTITLNPADKASDIVLSSGNMVATKTFADTLSSVRATRGISHTDSGYFEIVVLGSPADSPYMLVGLARSSLGLTGFVGSDANSWGYYQETGQKYTSNTGAAYGTSWIPASTVIGVAFKNGKLWFAKNNTWQNSGNPAAGTGEAFSGLTGTLFPTLSLYRATGATAHQLGFRAKAADFTYSPPTGFLAWEY